MPVHEDCINQLEILTESLMQDLQTFDSRASTLLRKGVFSLSGALDGAQRETRKTLMVPAHLRRCLEQLDGLLKQIGEYDHGRLLSEVSSLFAAEPAHTSTTIPLNILFSHNVAVLSRKARQGAEAGFHVDVKTNTLYITCLSEKTLEHLDKFCQAVTEHAKSTEVEPIPDETDTSASPESSPGASPS